MEISIYTNAQYSNGIAYCGVQCYGGDYEKKTFATFMASTPNEAQLGAIIYSLAYIHPRERSTVNVHTNMAYFAEEWEKVKNGKKNIWETAHPIFWSSMIGLSVVQKLDVYIVYSKDDEGVKRIRSEIKNKYGV